MQQHQNVATWWQKILVILLGLATFQKWIWKVPSIANTTTSIVIVIAATASKLQTVKSLDMFKMPSLVFFELQKSIDFYWSRIVSLPTSG